LTRFYHDMDKFYDRAVTDCAITVDAGEKARLDYRGSLLWMKKISDEVDQYNSFYFSSDSF
jgi:islet cell auto antigen 1